MKSLVEEGQRSVFSEEPDSAVLKRLEVRSLRAEEQVRAKALLEREHALGFCRPVGRCLTQVVHDNGRWVALLFWAAPARKLADRDEWIGWTHTQRAERLALVVQNRRFLILSEARLPNLASRALGLALRALPEAWEQAHGFRPLLAETFTDIEQFEGTCYNAAGWIACGLTQGFERHRADFYQRHDRPKKLWLKPLQRNTRQLLCAMDLPPAYGPALDRQSPERLLPIKANQVRSLREALRAVPDPRAKNRVFPCSSLLGLVAIGLMAGRRHLAEIHRLGQFLTQQQREWLGWPRRANGAGRRAPSYKALYNLLTKLDPSAFAEALSQWLASWQGKLPRALALDGKFVRGQVLTLCLSDHETGAPTAIALAEPSTTPDQKEEGELTVAKRLYKNADLDGAIVTADALHCQKETTRQIVEGGGDYLLQLKDNQSKALERAQATAQIPPLFPPQV